VAGEVKAVDWRGFVVQRTGAGENSIDCPLDEGGQRRGCRAIDVAAAVIGPCGLLQFLDVSLD
jgi:hypothetical protein